MAILNTNVKNANIKFLNGLQSDLNDLITNGGAIKGAFYLTSDTHRLYIGQEDNNRTDLTAGAQRVVPVPLNEGVTTVANVQALTSIGTTEAGAFYYAAQENILCVYNGNTWVQINPDTNTIIQNIYHNIVTTSTATTLNTRLRDNNGDEVSANLEFVGANGVTITSTSEASFNGNTYNPNAVKRITITGDSYSLSNSYTSTSKTATITLASSDSNKPTSSVNIVAKDNITLGTENGNITIAAEDKYINSIAINNNGSNTSGFTVRAGLNNGDAVSSTFDPIIHFDVDGGSDYHFINGIANLPLYTKSEIDLVLRQLNSMTYKGVIGYGQLMTTVPNGSSNDSSGNPRRVAVGDSYKIGATDGNGTDGGFTIQTGASSSAIVHKGDVIIAQGTEYTASTIPSGRTDLIGTIDPSTLYWDYIPSGDDTFIETTYIGRALQHGIALYDSAGNSTLQFKVLGDNNYITIADTVDPTPTNNVYPNNQTVTIQHKLVDTSTYQDSTVAVSSTTTQVANSTMNIPVITGVVRDAAGHVLKIETTTYRVTDTNADVGTYEAETSSDANKTYSKVDTTLILKDANGSNINTTKNKASFVIESTTMQVDSGTKTIGTDTFDSIKMELVWGEFT